MIKLLNKLWEILVFILDFFIRKVFRISLSDAQWKAFLQFIKFGIVGVSNTLIHYFTYLICIFAGCHYLIASVIGFLVSVMNAFYWNNKYVFKLQNGEKRNLGLALLKTYLSYAFTGIILNNILSVIWIEVLHISKFIAPVINIIVSMPINFLINKFWSFRAKK